MSYYKSTCWYCGGRGCSKCRLKGYLLLATNADEKVRTYFTGLSPTTQPPSSESGMDQ
jgi:hypothetical protein